MWQEEGELHLTFFKQKINLYKQIFQPVNRTLYSGRIKAICLAKLVSHHQAKLKECKRGYSLQFISGFGSQPSEAKIRV